MKLLNIGCGYHYSNKSEWTNLDFIATGENVIAHNLLKGIPFEDESFDFVYHSHVLEHFQKEDGVVLIKECFRVLKKGGILRIVIPDLESIIENYLTFLKKGLENPDDDLNRANYNWMMIELFDQTVRNSSGGYMAEYLGQKDLSNEEFVYTRIGEEGKQIRSYLKNKKENKKEKVVEKHIKKSYLQKFKSNLKHKILAKLNVQQNDLNNEYSKIGKFRLGGEIHQWMYDRYSLSYLLKIHGGINIKIKTATSSNLENWETYALDGENGMVRKPDSLFIECIKA
jgi:predicted SAM-dependent methyltransferase